MSLRVVLIASGVIALLLGFYFIFLPDNAIASFEIGASDVASRLLMRGLGGSLVALGIVNLLSSADRGSPALLAIVVGNIAVHIINPLLDLIETFPWTAGRWASIAIHAVFLVAFGYYLANWNRVTEKA
jgi:hypothetical protein